MRRRTLLGCVGAAALSISSAHAAEPVRHKERAYLANAANAAKFRADRARNGTNENYCWKS
jgi:hypothetical protein